MTRICKSDINFLAFIVPEITMFIQTDVRTVGYGLNDPSSDPDRNYIYFVGLKKLPSTCYIIVNQSKSSKCVYSTSIIK